jgi:hypothetical protein
MDTWERFWYAAGIAIGTAVAAGRTVTRRARPAAPRTRAPGSARRRGGAANLRPRIR